MASHGLQRLKKLARGRISLRVDFSEGEQWISSALYTDNLIAGPKIDTECFLQVLTCVLHH